MDQKPSSNRGQDSIREALVEGLPGTLRGVARGLLAAEGKGESAQVEALQRFLEVGFTKTEHLVEGALFLTQFYAEDEAWLAKHLGVQEIVQELSYGGGALTGVVAEWWMRQRDLVRLVRLVDGLLAAKLHLRTPDCLNVMLALTCSIALHKPQRGSCAVGSRGGV
jgi:hypothetical protein